MKFRTHPLCRAVAGLFFVLGIAGLVAATAAPPVQAASGKRTGYSVSGKKSYSGYRKSYRHGRNHARHFGYRNHRKSGSAVASRRSGVVLGSRHALDGHRYAVRSHRYKGGYHRHIRGGKRHHGWRGHRHWRKAAHPYWRKHGQRHPAESGWRSAVQSGALVISVHSGLADPVEQPAIGGSRTYLENECKPGEYCVLRLGPSFNAPKIITLNESGKTLSPDGAVSDPSDPDEPAEETLDK